MAELQRVSPALWGLAEAALLAGDPQRAIAWCERGEAASRPVADAAYLFPFLVTGTRAHLAAGDPAAAAAWTTRVSDAVAHRGIPGTMPAIDHARGLLELSNGSTGRARASLELARGRWHEHQRAWEGSWATLDLAATLARCQPAGRRAPARRRGRRACRAPGVGAPDAGRAGPARPAEGAHRADVRVGAAHGSRVRGRPTDRQGADQRRDRHGAGHRARERRRRTWSTSSPSWASRGARKLPRGSPGRRPCRRRPTMLAVSRGRHRSPTRRVDHAKGAIDDDPMDRILGRRGLDARSSRATGCCRVASSMDT